MRAPTGSPARRRSSSPRCDRIWPRSSPRCRSSSPVGGLLDADSAPDAADRVRGLGRGALAAGRGAPAISSARRKRSRVWRPGGPGVRRSRIRCGRPTRMTCFASTTSSARSCGWIRRSPCAGSRPHRTTVRNARSQRRRDSADRVGVGAEHDRQRSRHHDVGDRAPAQRARGAGRGADDGRVRTHGDNRRDTTRPRPARCLAQAGVGARPLGHRLRGAVPPVRAGVGAEARPRRSTRAMPT